MIEVLPPQPRIQPIVLLKDVKPTLANCHPTKNIESFKIASPTYRVKSPVNNNNDDDEGDTSDASSENSDDDQSSSESYIPKKKVKVVPTPKKEMKGLIKCSNCSYTCSQAKLLKEHRLRQHNEGNVTICICGFIFLNSDHYKSHLNLVKNEKNQKKLNAVIAKKKKELGLKKYQWIHTEKLRAPKPDNAVYVI